MKCKRIVSALLVLAALLSALPGQVFAQGNAAAAQVTAAGITLNRTSLTLLTGQSFRLKLSSDKKCTWSTSNKNIATVTSKGTVKAKKAGTVTITCRLAGGTKLKCTVTVKPAATVKLTKIEDGDLYVKFTNNASKKVKRLDMTIKQYSKKGRLLSSMSYVSKYAVGAKASRIFLAEARDNVYSVKMAITKVTYTDGTTWIPGK